MTPGQLVKMEITAFKNSSYDLTDIIAGGRFPVLVNPENYSIEYQIKYQNCKTQAQGTSGFDPKWGKNPPRELTFEFLFDGTNAIEGVNPLFNAALSENEIAQEDQNQALARSFVTDQLKLFEATVFKVSGQTHAPNYLQILWGTLVFKCRLSSMTVNYKLFSPEGLPVRATVKASFREVVNQEDEVKRNNLTSPSVTHSRIAKDGDRLPNMARAIYNNERFYLAVAQANKLIQFRNLKAGQEVLFPPIKKENE
jgi:hypothetical protein